MNKVFYIVALAGWALSIEATQQHKEKTRYALKTHSLIVKTALKQYTLTFNRNKVAIKGYMMNLSLHRKKCNAHILDRFNQDIKQIIKKYKKDLKKEWKGKQSIATLKVQIGDQHYFMDGRSKAGLVFLAVPKEIIRMKTEEKLNCPTKKPSSHKKAPSA